MPVLRGPTSLENLWSDIWLLVRYKQDRGITLLVEGTTVTETQYPYQGDLQSGIYDYIYLGGHEYSLTPEEVTILTNAGYGAYIFPD